MLILTKDEKGNDQWWEVFYDKSFVYIEHHHHPPYLQTDVGRHLHTFDYSQLRISPLISGNNHALRGTVGDPTPFVIRGKSLGPITLRVRNYASNVTGWLEKSSMHPHNWNFTDAQKSKIFNQYFPQIAKVVEHPDFVKQIQIDSTIKVINSLRKQIDEKRTFLLEVESILNLPEYQLTPLNSPLL